ncbi:DNA polymerase delta subunit 3 [Hirschfeldia incana]|nr:DNA polymerase delta subunit 3 [Hirschfeldia incana]
MTHTETLNILDELESLVTDQLQVVSYKWLSRNFSRSSKTAKSLLKDFVEKNGKDLEVVYIVSGWLKNTPSNHCTRLISSSKLSVSIYSVQASIPTEPAAIWSSEFVQAEELFMQPSATDNCLRDNRFCGISNSFVKRSIVGDSANVTAPRTETVKTTVQPKSGLNRQEGTAPIPKVGHQAKNETMAAPAQKKSVPASKKNGQAEKSVTGTGASLKNMWGRVPVKAEDDSAKIEVKNNDHSEAQKPSNNVKSKGGSDDEAPDVSTRNRKRKVIFDFSDEECEDVISLASPSSPKTIPRPDSEETKEDSGVEKTDERVSRETKTDEPEVSEEDFQKTAAADTSGVKKEEKPVASSKEKIQAIGSEAGANPSKGRVVNAPSSPKRKKVLKTRIDERGREVTEVVWEGTETNGKEERRH